MTLETIPDLFRRCRGRETGHWRVGGESNRTVYLDSGDIVFASSNFKADRLTTILVDRKKLTQDQMDYAMANLKQGMSVGKNLIEMGFITQRDLLDAARQQVERIVWSALVSPETPVFEAKSELEESIVRLPIDTPSLLFAGVMGITDRNGLLELLGPINQVVLLQGKKVFELELPSDLAKMAPLMDGTHTILELSSEAAVEPMRTGAFALFLREMGWGKLYELPPLDRQAIDKALDVPDPTKPPESIPSPRSMLFQVIEDAGKQTVRLDHLSSMLDGIATAKTAKDDENHTEPLYGEIEDDGPEPEPQPNKQPGAKTVGRVLPLPKAPEQLLQEPSVIISRDDEIYDDPPPAQDKQSNGNKMKFFLRVLVGLAIAIALTVAVYSIWKLKTRSADPPFTLDPADTRSLDSIEIPSETEPKPPETKPDQGTAPPASPPAATLTVPETNPPETKPPDQKPETSQTSPTPSQTPQPTQPVKPPVEVKPVNFSTAARFSAIADGDTNKALAQGKAFKESLSGSTWSIRLVVACQGETLQNCAQVLGPSRPELFLTHIRLRDGRLCYQLFMGKYSNKNAAEAEAKKLPDIFRKGQTPRVMQIREIATEQ